MPTEDVQIKPVPAVRLAQLSGLAPDFDPSVHAGIPVGLEPDPAHDFEVFDLPALEQAATILRHGPMDDLSFSGKQPRNA